MYQIVFCVHVMRKLMRRDLRRERAHQIKMSREQFEVAHENTNINRIIRTYSQAIVKRGSQIYANPCNNDSPFSFENNIEKV